MDHKFNLYLEVESVELMDHKFNLYLEVESVELMVHKFNLYLEVDSLQIHPALETQAALNGPQTHLDLEVLDNHKFNLHQVVDSVASDNHKFNLEEEEEVDLNNLPIHLALLEAVDSNGPQTHLDSVVSDNHKFNLHQEVDLVVSVNHKFNLHQEVDSVVSGNHKFNLEEVVDLDKVDDEVPVIGIGIVIGIDFSQEEGSLKDPSLKPCTSIISIVIIYVEIEFRIYTLFR